MSHLTGYNAADPVYLSFSVGKEFTRSDLHLWRYDGAAWSSFSANDVTCADGYASFTVTGFSGYAVSAVPEPSGLGCWVWVCCWWQ